MGLARKVQFHWKLALGAQFFPGVNKDELALLYSVLFLFIACRGTGPWSLERRPAQPEYIRTVREIGYRFESEESPA